MNDRSAETSDPPLTRRELRRREEAARGAQEAPKAAQDELPPAGPQVPAETARQPRSSPSGRVPQRAIDEAAGVTPPDTAGRSAAPGYDWEDAGTGTAYVRPPVRHPSRAKRFFRGIGQFFRGLWGFTKFVVLTGVLVAAGWFALTHFAPGFTADTVRLLASHGITDPFSGVFPEAQGATSRTGTGSPPPGTGASDHPLGVPVPTAANSNSYAFLRAGTDQPFVSYDPCRPIHYVIRTDNAPAGGGQAVTEAVAAVSRATGFVFINDGVTSETPALDRPAYQRERYGDRWAPVLFAWETTQEEPQFTEDWTPGSSTILGLGGSIGVTVDGSESAYVTGQVRLNAAALGTISQGPDGHTRLRAVVQHELAHVVGLDHVPDPAQLMAARMSGRITDFAAGDLTGLAVLGKGKCRPAL
ncbi:hypothetical protein Achl_4080 (plasmid) [Pseudarthrobacter chlorophenolicus A6]|uniref:Uncharacterized protein n=1 Tax=Pseudarthrobacter chlorophenolicus (strain ATCC 700700 / DSM 12829 / CIP 107037 / JCM 12360 / KCTC 9906 / NCIMB 13794 / A6) TaxID=452863 RepID=B8HHY4_PSECP|nr:matrixin family metalloprotease [Pseudarthrobacter chlorophenolicus]ACL42031.1 hypothetical protein Achl_4080 [Pseudarthrobacter chlorophenolicus A6]SDQ20567.1 Matrixin [Pseudarthrobacter chlorophenolicus]